MNQCPSDHQSVAYRTELHWLARRLFLNKSAVYCNGCLLRDYVYNFILNPKHQSIKNKPNSTIIAVVGALQCKPQQKRKKQTNINDSIVPALLWEDKTSFNLLQAIRCFPKRAWSNSAPYSDDKDLLEVMVEWESNKGSMNSLETSGFTWSLGFSN